ncbi:MAG: HAMP domain-containing protein [Actinobacteria bacterium]|uniref:histidine kinase n=1 Tax=freshwater metagenome TaxID=449393 RepID=A0A6J7PHK1_9ZZZZ|nr:HAMP domain-containing protein [Actinomycetota bacterium]
MTATRPRLATRLMAAQAIVVGIGAVTLVVSAMLVAPGLFHDHLTQVGVNTPDVQLHAEEAFASSFAISVAVATVVSLLAAGLVSWFLVRRVSRPVEELALAAQGVAGGNFAVDVPDAAFSRELHELSESFTFMAQRLSQSESIRTRLLADLAHELRTPLATLEAYIDGMEDDVVSQEAMNYATMRLQVDRLRRLSDDLREAAAAEEHALGPVLRPIDAREVAATAVAAADPRYQSKGVGLALANSLTPCWIMADFDRLQQVLANLLDNALRHTPAQGHVSVQVECASGLVQIRVSDTGEGIPVDQLSSVFERFHRVDPSRVSTDGSGSGLGLTIARAIVAAHGGTLEAHSAGVGSGTTFRVELPLDSRVGVLRHP